MGKQRDILKKLAGTFQIRHVLLRQAMAECLGTFILVVSGHLNPAVTFSLCLLGREPWRKFPLFFFFQTLGAFLGAAVVFGMYFDALWDISQGELIVVGNNATAGIFATYPSKHLSLVNGFFDQIIGTAALIVCILAIVDPRNNPVPRGLEPLTVGLVVLVIGLSMGFNSGYAVNPARTWGHASSPLWQGGEERANTYWFFVPLCAPFLGAAVGVLIYQLLIGYHLEGEVQKKQEEERSKRSNMTTNEEA
ncbi:hypothetical protein F7725_015874 [Dissostichus mawsoni]|uniref:Aquaporin-3 n=1 Tax=Dissostichus mawsoni TaxID=36200 RepID=A0A7J5YLN3_DISMA|nr:hypothetical protein F7725_015874 [Dissostichus mawsoni]